MLYQTKVVKTFPSIQFPSLSDGLPVEISLIAQLGHGAGNHIYASVVSRQKFHASFIDELDEPSAKLAGTDFSKGDATSLYSFVVGPKGHPFHRHAGHRIFTAISGSGGAQLRFSTASEQQIAADPSSFIRALRYVNIPPDCLFAVRFGGETWHQFAPLSRNSLHPVFFALSCHTNELGGNLAESLKADVIANKASIPSLTELLPPEVAVLLQSKDVRDKLIPTTTLALDAPEGTLHRTVCNTVRGSAGLIRGAWSSTRKVAGFASSTGHSHQIKETKSVGAESLLRQHLSKETLAHEDAFHLTLENIDRTSLRASHVLAALLEGFLLNAPSGVSALMAFRNLLVKPLGLRTSPLGCPVSSLLSPKTDNLFANQYPVLDQAINEEDTKAEVILGANDKHLNFRSCVRVEFKALQQIEISLENRVACKNLFGKIYLTAIERVHRRYISPTMLRMAVEFALAQIQHSVNSLSSSGLRKPQDVLEMP